MSNPFFEHIDNNAGKGKGSGNGSTPPVEATFRDPWASPTPPKWPTGILGEPFDEMVQMRAEEQGIDLGAVGLTTLAAISGAAPKNTLIAPYGQQPSWRQSAIIWVMIIAQSGHRKTALDLPSRKLNEIQFALEEEYRNELAAWEALAASKNRGPKPSEPHVYMVTDPNVESLQDVLAAHDRGTFLKRDELAGWFNSFVRYGGAQGSDYRQCALEGYEAQPSVVTRIKRGRLFIKVNGFTVCGYIQPDRLASYKDLDVDGFISRFIPYWMRDVAEATPVGFIRGEELFDKRIAQLAEQTGGRLYEPTPGGIDIIRRMERDALEMARLNDFGSGFSGFCRKLHGTLARCALILHLLDNPDPENGLIPDATIVRAEALVRDFILPAAVAHHKATAPQTERTRDIAGWLLTSAPQAIRASDFAANVRSCRNLSARELNDALDPLVTGGWLDPDNPYPSNRKWDLDLRVRPVFADRAAAEQARRESIRALWEKVAV